MPISENHRDLFFHSATSGKLDLFQSLLDSKDLTFEEALALLSAVHAELEQPKAHPSSMYIHYAEMVESLHQQMPEVHDQVVNVWRARRGIVLAEKKSVERLLGTQIQAKPEATGEIVEEFVEEGQVEDVKEETGAAADHMASEAAEAAAESEYAEVEMEEAESPGEEEPPTEAGE